MRSEEKGLQRDCFNGALITEIAGNKPEKIQASVVCKLVPSTRYS